MKKFALLVLVSLSVLTFSGCDIINDMLGLNGGNGDPETVATPTLSPAPGTYDTAQSVTISCATAGADIYYSTDGTSPDSSSTEYTGAIPVATTTTIVTFAAKDGMYDSGDATGTYTITPARVATPTFDPAEGTYSSSQSVRISSTTAGVTIRYTTNGTTPTSTTGTVYTGSVTISTSTTLNAIAYKSGWTDSSVATATYTISTPSPGEAAEMVSVPVGSFQMGWDGIVTPIHTVALGAFKIAKYEVTYDLWYSVRIWAGDNGYTFANLGREGNDGTDGAVPSAAKDEPVTYIAWRDAIAWCNARSEKEGRTPCYYKAGQAHTTENVYKSSSTDGDIGNTDVEWSANGYRLPTDAEWEYAARYVNGATFTRGDWVSGASAAGQEGTYAWYSGNSGSSTHIVGQKAANALGTYDMSGSVWEWCWDWWASGYGASAESDPRGPLTGSNRVVRGGSWSYLASVLPCSYRTYGAPSYTRHDIGLRPVRTGP